MLKESSSLNAQIGARSQMASIITSICVILTTLFLLPLFTYLPKVRGILAREQAFHAKSCATQAILSCIIVLVSVLSGSIAHETMAEFSFGAGCIHNSRRGAAYGQRDGRS